MSAIRRQSAGAVRTVTLARPDKRNALDRAMLSGLVTGIAAEPGPRERVTVIQAEGSAFCAGLDLSIRHAEGAPEGASPIETVLTAIDRSPLPVIAAVRGPAVAGGCELALAADLLVAADTAPFSMPLARLGTAPTWELMTRLVTRLGPYLAQELLLTGTGVPARRIAAAGAAIAVPDQRFDEALSNLTESVTAAAPRAIQAIRRMMGRIKDGGVLAQHEDIDELIADIRQGDDAREGIAANREHRAPRFQGYQNSLGKRCSLLRNRTRRRVRRADVAAIAPEWPVTRFLLVAWRAHGAESGSLLTRTCLFRGYNRGNAIFLRRPRARRPRSTNHGDLTQYGSAGADERETRWGVRDKGKRRGRGPALR